MRSASLFYSSSGDVLRSPADDWIMPPNPVGAGRKEMVKKLKKLRAACWDLPPEEAPALPAASHELYDETYELHSEY